MKKLLAIFLIIPSIVFANSKEATVTVGEVDTDNPKEEDKVIDVEIKWNKMTFTYNVENNYTWDKTTHKYTKNKEKKYWTNNGNNIVVTNKTNKKITLYPTYKSSYKNITGKFNLNKIELEGNTNKLITFELNGTLTKSYNNTKIGYITISLE